VLRYLHRTAVLAQCEAWSQGRCECHVFEAKCLGEYLNLGDRVNVEWRILLLLLCCYILFKSGVRQSLGIATSNGPILLNPNDDDRCIWSIGGIAVGRGT
jgi:hypothetical protein